MCFKLPKAISERKINTLFILLEWFKDILPFLYNKLGSFKQLENNINLVNGC